MALISVIISSENIFHYITYMAPNYKLAVLFCGIRVYIYYIFMYKFSSF
jgi:hypothetical protein